MTSFYPVLAALAAYLVGSLSFAVIVSRLMGLQDPRTFGSKNPGATNVLRSGNKAAAIVTLLLDAAKGAVPVALTQYLGPAYGLADGTVAMVALAAFLGHLFPVYFRFQGGKGVATAAGVLIALNGWLALATLASFAIIVFFSRYVSLASVVAAVFAPAYYLLGDGVAWSTDRGIFMAIAVMGVLMVWRHWPNIDRLLAGKEAKLGAKK